jgi:hypothetical protein
LFFQLLLLQSVARIPTLISRPKSFVSHSDGPNTSGGFAGIREVEALLIVTLDFLTH